MGKKIFVSYKYSDKKVRPIDGNKDTTAREYVDKLEKLLEKDDHIYKGENDDEPLDSLADSTIGSKLGDKIFDSTVTIVLISKGMKEDKPENDQWIPWEISYSLREQSREGVNSKTNAVLAVVVPDELGKYDYYITENHECNSRTLNTDSLFQILRDNMFNIKDKEKDVRDCKGSKIYTGFPSYIYTVKWEDFVNNVNHYIDIANERRQNIDKYELVKTIR
ncbi:MAG TPA: TIR domain-containing protein [Bacteroidia bacterium]|nr:TIR domain-containing protein [Bacteroidia bacterium]